MKLYDLVVIAAILSVTAPACKKENKPAIVPSPANVPDYAHLKSGNYWIYRSVWKDTIGNEVPGQTAEYDSNYVDGDTMIGTHTYAKFWQVSYTTGHPELSLWRYASQSIIDENGHVFFDAQNYNTLLHESYRVDAPGDTVSKITLHMDGINVPVVTDAGSFITRGVKETYDLFPNYQVYYNPRMYHTYYSDSVGIVSRELIGFLQSAQYLEKKLVRYHVQ